MRNGKDPYAGRTTARENVDRMEATMLRDQVINFLEAAVVLLMLTNAVSIATTAYVLALAQRVVRVDSRAATQAFPAPWPRWLRVGKLTQ
jgi:hypothetical protein